MRLGFALPIAGEWATPENLVRVARHGEALGYASLWVFQRLLYPAAPREEYYGAPGGPWPPAFQSVLDPVVALSFAAAHTERIRLGTSVLIVPFYSPVVLAKQLASLDVVSRGRLDVGLGLGWSRDEYTAAGAAWGERGARADEFIACLKAAWTADEAEFQGRFYTLPRSRVHPRPVQRPHPPIYLGGYSDAVFRRTAEQADGYTGGNIPLGEMAQVVDRLRLAAARAGRDGGALPIVCRASYRLTAAPLGAGRRTLWGSAGEIRDDIARYREHGVSELFLDPNFQPDGPRLDQVLADMETFAPGGDTTAGGAR